jgi:hypothetical protein
MSEAAAIDLCRQQSTNRLPVSARVAEASVMLDLFKGLGVRSINLTVTDEAGRKRAFYRYRTVETLRATLPGLLEASFDRRRNVIVRPIAPRAFVHPAL